MTAPVLEYRTERIRRGRAGDRKLNRLAEKGWKVENRTRQLNAYDRVMLSRPKQR